MNRQIRLVGLGIMVLFVALFVQLNWLQIVHAPALEANPSTAGPSSRSTPPSGRHRVGRRDHPGHVGADQRRVQVPAEVPHRCAVRSDHRVLLLHLRLRRGRADLRQGPDREQQSRSSCRPASASCATCWPTRPEPVVTLTVLDKLQKVAQTATGRPGGSVVALDPRTGAILAMYSNPSFDPNLLSGHNQTQVQANYKALTADPAACWPRAPTASAASRARRSRSSPPRRCTTTSPPWPPRCTRRCRPCRCPRPRTCCTTSVARAAAGQLPELFTVSCDTGFGQIGLDLGGQALYSEARLRFQSDAAHRPALRGPVRLPARRQLRSGPARPGLLGDRPAERAGHARCRWPWSAGGHRRRRAR